MTDRACILMTRPWPNYQPEGLVSGAVHGLGVRIEVRFLNEGCATLIAWERPVKMFTG